MNINIYYDNVRFRLRESTKIKRLIAEVIGKEEKVPGDLSFIITSDKTLRNINKEFLNHNYYTDVIAFNYSVAKRINGEVYISIDTVRENAANYKISLKREILKVFIHGVLHLCGYDDKTKREKNVMSDKEDFWVEKYVQGKWN